MYNNYVCKTKRIICAKLCHTSKKICRVQCTSRWADPGQARYWLKELRWQSQTLREISLTWRKPYRWNLLAANEDNHRRWRQAGRRRKGYSAKINFKLWSFPTNMTGNSLCLWKIQPISSKLTRSLLNQYSRTASAISSLPSPKIVFQAATNLSVKNEPDSQIFLSDHLSRAVRDETSGTEE